MRFDHNLTQTGQVNSVQFAGLIRQFFFISEYFSKQHNQDKNHPKLLFRFFICPYYVNMSIAEFESANN